MPRYAHLWRHCMLNTLNTWLHGDERRFRSRNPARAIKKWKPGTVWGAGGEFVVCWEKSHLKNAYEYVIYVQGPGAWTWSYRDANDDGMLARPEPAERARRKRNRRRRK